MADDAFSYVGHWYSCLLLAFPTPSYSLGLQGEQCDTFPRQQRLQPTWETSYLILKTLFSLVNKYDDLMVLGTGWCIGYRRHYYFQDYYAEYRSGFDQHDFEMFIPISLEHWLSYSRQRSDVWLSDAGFQWWTCCWSDPAASPVRPENENTCYWEKILISD